MPLTKAMCACNIVPGVCDVIIPGQIRYYGNPSCTLPHPLLQVYSHVGYTGSTPYMTGFWLLIGAHRAWPVHG